MEVRCGGVFLYSLLFIVGLGKLRGSNVELFFSAHIYPFESWFFFLALTDYNVLSDGS